MTRSVMPGISRVSIACLIAATGLFGDALAAASSASASRFFLAAQKVRQALVEERYGRAVAIDEELIRGRPKGSYAAMAMLEMGIVSSWCLGDAAKAESMFQRAAQAAGQDRAGRRCAEIARRHLANSRLARVKEALRKYYSRKIEFPLRLSALVDLQLLAKEDSATPWGAPWRYERRASDLFPDIEGQEYVLACMELGEDLLPAPELRRQWLSLSRRFALWAAGSRGEAGAMARIEYLEAGVSTKKRKITLKEGERLEGLDLIHVAAEGAVLAGKDFLIHLPLRVRR